MVADWWWAEEMQALIRLGWCQSVKGNHWPRALSFRMRKYLSWLKARPAQYRAQGQTILQDKAKKYGHLNKRQQLTCCGSCGMGINTRLKQSSEDNTYYESDTPLLWENGTPVISSTTCDTPKSAIRGSPSALMTMFGCGKCISTVKQTIILVGLLLLYPHGRWVERRNEEYGCPLRLLESANTLTYINRFELNQTATNHSHVVNVRVLLDIVDGGPIWLVIKLWARFLPWSLRYNY